MRSTSLPGGIFWFDAENPSLAPVLGGVIADALAVGPGSLEERAASAVRLASSGPPVLVVLDNVESWTSDSEPRPLPSGSHVTVLVTTRHKWLGGSSFQHHTLEVLGLEAARALLGSVAGRVLEREDGSEELLAYLDGHALALELAGAYLREFPSVSPRQYLDDLVAGGHAEDRVKDLVRYERSVRQALDVHVRHLDRTARRALRIAACFAPENASASLLELCGVGPDAQQLLRRFHLISGVGDRWRMHRLVRSWVDSKGTSKQRRIARQAFVDGCVALAKTINLAEGFRVYRADGPHLEHAVTDIVQVFGESDLRLADLLDRLGTTLQSAGDLLRAREMMERALALDESYRAADELLVARHRSNFALVLDDLGDFQRARELLELALAVGLKTFGVDQSWLATLRANLGAVLYQLDDVSRAKELMEKALASELTRFGADHPTVPIHRANLALMLQELGDLPRAKDLLEQALVSELKILGADHPSVAIIRFNLARVCVAQNDFPGARVLLTHALESQELSLGPDHPYTAYTRALLADVLSSLGETESARREVERAVQAVAAQPPGSKYRRDVEFISMQILKGSA